VWYVWTLWSGLITCIQNGIFEVFLSQWSADHKVQSYFTTGGLPPIRSSWHQAPWAPQPKIFFQLTSCGNGPYVTSSLTRGWVCRLQLLLALATAVVLRSKSHRTQDHILLSQIWDSPNLEGQVAVFISPRIRVAKLYPQALGSLFVASYDLQGYGGGIWTCLHMGYCRPQFAHRLYIYIYQIVVRIIYHMI
jgi:hypothetical protein